MKIFIDSNQFIADFLLKSAPFRYLLHFLSNSGGTLLLSKIVVEEVENKYATEAQKALDDAAKTCQKLKQLGLSQADAPDLLIAFAPLNLEEQIRSHVENIEIVEYADVPQTEVVRRALGRRKPFDADGAVGYRDCLLWLSLVKYLGAASSSEQEDIIFISGNWRDFYAASSGKQGKSAKDGREKPVAPPEVPPGDPETSTSSAGVKFHPELAQDLTNLKSKVLPFESIAAFVNAVVDRRDHVINYEKRFDIFEEYIEKSGLEVLGRLDERNGSTVLKTVFSPAIANALTILSSDAEIFEGVEDFDIYLAEEVGKDVYISCGYDLRIVNVTLFVPRAEFDRHRYEIEANPHVWEVNNLAESVAIRLSLRAYYQASFNFNPITRRCDGFSLETFSVR